MGDFHRVLVVDDDDDVRAFIGDVLGGAGYDVVDVDNGSHALAFLARERASLVLLDLQMRDVTGWEVITHLRGRHPALPIIVVTGASPTAVPPRLPCLRKPFSGPELLAIVREHLKGAGDPRPRRDTLTVA